MADRFLSLSKDEFCINLVGWGFWLLGTTLWACCLKLLRSSPREYCVNPTVCEWGGRSLYRQEVSLVERHIITPLSEWWFCEP